MLVQSLLFGQFQAGSSAFELERESSRALQAQRHNSADAASCLMHCSGHHSLVPEDDKHRNTHTASCRPGLLPGEESKGCARECVCAACALGSARVCVPATIHTQAARVQAIRGHRTAQLVEIAVHLRKAGGIHTIGKHTTTTLKVHRQERIYLAAEQWREICCVQQRQNQVLDHTQFRVLSTTSYSNDVIDAIV